MTIKAIIFDLDGVLTESMDYHIQSWKCALNQYTIFPTDNDLAMLEGMSYRETIDTLSGKYAVALTDEDKEKIYLLKKDTLAGIFQSNVYPYVLDILELLKERNIRLALVSGANREFVHTIVKEFFDDFFEVIITGSDVKRGKPDPEPYITAVEKLHCNPKDILVIENAPLGIESAKGANLRTYALTTTLDKQFLGRADKIFTSHKELLEDIKNIT